MKTIKYIITLLAFSGILLSCGYQLREGDHLTDRDAKESISEAYLLASMIRDVAMNTANKGWMDPEIPAAIQTLQQVTYGQCNSYEGFADPKDEMNSLLRMNIFVNESSYVAEKNKNKSYQGVFLIFKSYLFMRIADLYGDSYYAEAFKGKQGNFYPKYSNQKDIYYGLCHDLDSANTLIMTGVDPIDPIQDIMYGGDKLKWRKLANSLRLRAAMRLAEKENAKAKAEIGTVLSDATKYPIMTTVSDNAKIVFVGTTKNNSWLCGSYNSPNTDNFYRKKPCKTLVDILRTASDPRMSSIFAPLEKPWTDNPALDGVLVTDANGDPLKDPNTGKLYGSKWEYFDINKPEHAKIKENLYEGTINNIYEGARALLPHAQVNENGSWDGSNENANKKLSNFADLFLQNADKNKMLQAALMNADEVQFILAEAAVRGMISGSADSYYRDGIRLAMGRWGVSTPDDFFDRPSIKFSGSDAQKRELIAQQKFAALFLDGCEAYFDSRRTNLPAIIFSNIAATQYTLPLRYRYPTTEPGSNNAAYIEGVNALQPKEDNQFSKMWLLQ